MTANRGEEEADETMIAETDTRDLRPDGAVVVTHQAV
jgi:hypothetical protein